MAVIPTLLHTNTQTHTLYPGAPVNAKSSFVASDRDAAAKCGCEQKEVTGLEEKESNKRPIPGGSLLCLPSALSHCFLNCAPLPETLPVLFLCAVLYDLFMYMLSNVVYRFNRIQITPLKLKLVSDLMA